MCDLIVRLAHRFFGFSVVGIASTLISAFLFYLGVQWLNIDAVIVYIFAYLVTIVGSYLANAAFVFHVKVSVTEGMKFLCIYATGMLIGALLLRVLESIFPHVSPFWLGIGVMPITIGWNFFFVNYVMEKFSASKKGAL